MLTAVLHIFLFAAPQVRWMRNSRRRILLILHGFEPCPRAFSWPQDEGYWKDHHGPPVKARARQGYAAPLQGAGAKKKPAPQVKAMPRAPAELPPAKKACWPCMRDAAAPARTGESRCEGSQEGGIAET